ncbi:hypothetical protein TRP8649_00742 [Pelagimonas phthalicica]|uniref:Uncharacterized protein n=2 Tax=Pelagimonas phthalicica TaxID=1037362 RepID=A0A238J8Z6_9RHOB|nr:hypothetical protein CLV87_1329 [Pelagimonas phthalicica]SMX26657.1 hypothetical protein TRP8649_00742 [Pelagimonas phthalicica]
MLKHEYGDPTIFVFGRGHEPFDVIANHLQVLFQNAVKARRRPSWRVLLDSVVSTLPRGTKLKLVDERNSVGIALSHESIATVSALDRKLGLVVDDIGRHTEFGFGNQEIEHVCAADSMAALAFTTSRSGYARELGLAHVHGLGPTIGFAMIVLRLNDWVPQVRVASAKAIERLMKNDGGPNGGLPYMIAGSMGLLLDDARFGRMAKPERDVVEALISYPKVKDALRTILIFGVSDRAKNQILGLILQTGFYDELLPEVAEKAECSYRRLIAFKALLYRKYIWKEGGKVRERTIELPAHTSEVARRALLDKSANVAFAALGFIIETRDLSGLDDGTVEILLKRPEASLERRIALLRSMIGR